MTTPTLQGKHVRLEPLSLTHLDAIQELAQDPTIWTYMNGRIHDRASLQTWFDTAKKLHPHTWVTVLQSTGEVVGTSRYIDLDLRHRTVEIGNTWIAAPHRGTKVNPEAKLLQLTYAFEELKLQRVALKTHHNNLHSQAAMRKLGAQYEGTFRNHMIMDDGTTRHTVWFSITKEDWPAVKAGLETRLNN